MSFSNYKIVEAENKTLYHIKEVKTEHIIKTFSNFSEARKFLTHLNKGGGFAGWSPNFIVKSYENPNS